ncbi:DHHC palmitoyltransferase-domain-containing protein [Russula dissimulans]|nr:DHHC palmitoyltransferase-domain-containing protein [Russula dissimulans]
MTIVGILFPCLAVVYLHNCSGRATHSVPDYIAPEPQSITEPYECCSDGSLDYCVKDACSMRWKPPGTHHCSTCGVCRVGFDHHCPWLGNCITTGRLKAFLSLLVLTSVTVPLASLPLSAILRKHVVAALVASHADAWTTMVWWSRPYSWILCGGPAGRWVVGTLLGFRVLREQRIPETSWFTGSLVAQPHARVVILVSAGALLWLFAVFMTVAVATDVTKGQSTVDSVRFRLRRPGKTTRDPSRFVCIPHSNQSASFAFTSAVDGPSVPESSPARHSTQCTYPIPIKERIYDLGWRENWRRILAQPLFDHGTHYQGVYEWPKINPATIRHLLGSDGLQTDMLRPPTL